MDRALLNDAIEALERVNRGLAPETLREPEVNDLLARYARVAKLAAYGTTVLSGRVRDARAVAQVTGTSVGRARRTLETADVLDRAPELDEAMRTAAVSPDEAAEIARTETEAPGAAADLLEIAATEGFGVLRDRARQVRLTAQRGDLADRQRKARSLRHRVTDLGMVRIEADLEPHTGAGLVARLEATATRLSRHTPAAEREPMQRVLADALTHIAGTDPTAPSTGEGSRGASAEVVVLVSHEVTQRDWTDVRDGEICAIPGIGPIAPDTARRIANDAFLSGVLFDGTDLRQWKRWGRHVPTPIRLALRLGEPGTWDGPRCVGCGNRHRLQIDHDTPHAAGGPTSLPNSKLRCEDACHPAKTRRDHESGALHRRAPPDT